MMQPTIYIETGAEDIISTTIDKLSTTINLAEKKVDFYKIYLRRKQSRSHIPTVRYDFSLIYIFNTEFT